VYGERGGSNLTYILHTSPLPPDPHLRAAQSGEEIAEMRERLTAVVRAVLGDAVPERRPAAAGGRGLGVDGTTAARRRGVGSVTEGHAATVGSRVAGDDDSGGAFPTAPWAVFVTSAREAGDLCGVREVFEWMVATVTHAPPAGGRRGGSG